MFVLVVQCAGWCAALQWRPSAMGAHKSSDVVSRNTGSPTACVRRVSSTARRTRFFGLFGVMPPSSASPTTSVGRGRRWPTACRPTPLTRPFYTCRLCLTLCVRRRALRRARSRFGLTRPLSTPTRALPTLARALSARRSKTTHHPTEHVFVALHSAE